MNADVLEERLAAILFMYSRCRGYMSVVDAIAEMVAGRHVEELENGELAAAFSGIEWLAVVASDPELHRRAEELIADPQTKERVAYLRSMRARAQAITEATATKKQRRR